MIYNRFTDCTFLLYFSLLFATSTADADEFSEMEQKMRDNPPGMGNASDAVAIYSKISKRTIHNASNTQIESTQSLLIAEPETDSSDPIDEQDFS